jgi:hypothetical protein
MKKNLLAIALISSLSFSMNTQASTVMETVNKISFVKLGKHYPKTLAVVAVAAVAGVVYKYVKKDK